MFSAVMCNIMFYKKWDEGRMCYLWILMLAPLRPLPPPLSLETKHLQNSNETPSVHNVPDLWHWKNIALNFEHLVRTAQFSSPMGDTSVKIFERDTVSQLTTTPLNSIRQSKHGDAHVSRHGAWKKLAMCPDCSVLKTWLTPSIGCKYRWK